MECCRILTVPTPPGLAYYWNLVVGERPGAAVVWLIAAV